MKPPKTRLHSVMVLGATPAGVAAANKLGELGIPVTLVDPEADLDRKLGAESFRLDSGVPFNFAHRPGLIRILRNPGIRCLLPATVRSVKHNAQGFSIKIDVQQTFVDPGRCTLCGRCTAVCPAAGPGGALAAHVPGRLSLPGRAVIDKRRQPLCQVNCPLGVNVQGYLALVRAGRYAQASALIRKDNVLPAVCGRVCTHPCENACRRGEVDNAVAIRDIKRFVADEIPESPRPAHGTPRRPERIAVIGSGPAGIAAAAELARRGFAVTIYEKEKKAGGLLRYGIGPHRLPREILDRELEAILAAGVTIVCNSPVVLPEGLAELKRHFQAVVLTTGCWIDRRLGVPGEALEGVEGCLTFLAQVHRGEVTAVDGPAAVIGDGNAAFDLARTLRRLGADVTLLSWFSETELPADAHEVAAAAAEGVTIRERCQVVAFTGIDGRLLRLRLKPTRPGRSEGNGIAWPEIVPGSAAFEMPCRRAFVAIGQGGAYTSVGGGGGLAATPRGLILTDSEGRTHLARVYAGGDAVTGATTVVQAMANGRRVAARVAADLAGGAASGRPEPQALRPELRDFHPLDPLPDRCERIAMAELPLSRRRHAFMEVAQGYSALQAQSEARRCLQCGGCAQCLECIAACGPNDAIRHDEAALSLAENAGALIIADPRMAPGIKGEDVIRAYGPPSAGQDVHAMLLRGFSAAARAMVLLKKTDARLKGHGIAFVPPDPGLSRTTRLGVFACRCNDSFGWLPEMNAYLSRLANRPEVVHAESLISACIPEGIDRILGAVREKGITRLVLASCVCCPLNFVCSACTDQRSRLKDGLFSGTGIGRSMVQTCNLRGEVLRLVEKEPALALNRFKGLIERSIGRAAKLLPFPAPARTYNFATAVIGATEAGMAGALTMAEAGLEVYLFGTAANPLRQVSAHPNIHPFEGASVMAISGTLGRFEVHVRLDEADRSFAVGGIILGESSRQLNLYRRAHGLSGCTVQSGMQKEQVLGIPFMYPGSTSISGLFLADPPGIQISKQVKGSAAAVLAAAVMPRGPRQNRGFSVVVDEALCRGCGRCLGVCPYHAVALTPDARGGHTALVDEKLCKGCGNCISVCPSNAADTPYRDQAYLEETLEELLVGRKRI